MSTFIRFALFCFKMNDLFLLIYKYTYKNVKCSNDPQTNYFEGLDDVEFDAPLEYVDRFSSHVSLEATSCFVTGVHKHLMNPKNFCYIRAIKVIL